MRDRLATSLALLLVLALLGWAIWREGRTPQTAPQETVWRMLEASRSGDTVAYLSCFGGELERRLRAMGAELGEARFAEYLKRSAGELKGVALFDVDLAGDEADLVIEYVYPRESERQSLALRRSAGDWRITSATRGSRRQSLVPYGMPIEEVD